MADLIAFTAVAAFVAFMAWSLIRPAAKPRHLDPRP